MACCLVHARACWIESSRSPVEHSRSYPWTCWSKSVRTFAFAPPRHTRPLCLREGHGLLAPDHLQTLHAKFTVQPDLIHCFLLNGLRRLLRAALLPPGRVRPESSHRRTSRTACDLPARGCNIRPTASCTLDASPNSRTLTFSSTTRIGTSSNT
jgi:hypothetical protein